MIKNVLFIRPPKVAGTSISKALGMQGLHTSRRFSRFRQSGFVHFGHVNYPDLVRMLYVSREFDESSYKFSWVRDPYDRAVSIYRHMRLKSKNKRMFVSRGVADFHGFCNKVLLGNIRKIGLFNAEGFSACNPQIRWIENVKLDFLGRFENLEDDFNTLCDNIGVPRRALGHYLRIRRDKSVYELCCKDCIDIINKVYEEDFERFDYPIYN